MLVLVHVLEIFLVRTWIDRFLARSNARLVGSDEEEDENENVIERGLDLCRKVLIALLVFLGLLYYVTYEYDEVYYESQNGQVSWIPLESY